MASKSTAKPKSEPALSERIAQLRERLTELKRSAEGLRGHAKEVDRIAAEIHELQGRQLRGE